VESDEDITIEDVLRELHKKSINIKRLGMVTTALLVITVGLGWMVQGLNREVDSLKGGVDTVSASTNHVEKFVKQLEEDPTQEEVAQNQAVSQAVAQVPQIKSILCEQFPEASNCKESP